MRHLLAARCAAVHTHTVYSMYRMTLLNGLQTAIFLHAKPNHACAYWRHIGANDFYVFVYLYFVEIITYLALSEFFYFTL